MNSIIEVIKGDITKIRCDAIVNAANTGLMGGGGVDGAIHRVGGPEILEECKEIISKQGVCETGKAVITGAGKLPAGKVIHTVGPIWQGGNRNEEELLGNCYASSLRLAVNNGLKSIAFPNISTGIYGFPKERAAEIAIGKVNSFLKSNSSIEKVVFVCFDYDNYNLYSEIINNN